MKQTNNETKHASCVSEHPKHRNTWHLSKSLEYFPNKKRKERKKKIKERRQETQKKKENILKWKIILKFPEIFLVLDGFGMT